MSIKLIYNAKKRSRVKRLYDLGRNQYTGRGFFSCREISDFTGVKPSSVWQIGVGLYCPATLNHAE